MLDLYCGTGTIGMTMASKAGKVIGVEVVPEAIEDAKANAVKNIEFICGDSAQAVQMLRKRESVRRLSWWTRPERAAVSRCWNTLWMPCSI